MEKDKFFEDEEAEKGEDLTTETTQQQENRDNLDAMTGDLDDDPEQE